MPEVVDALHILSSLILNWNLVASDNSPHFTNELIRGTVKLDNWPKVTWRICDRARI